MHEKKWSRPEFLIVQLLPFLCWARPELPLSWPAALPAGLTNQCKGSVYMEKKKLQPPGISSRKASWLSLIETKSAEKKGR